MCPYGFKGGVKKCTAVRFFLYFCPKTKKK